MASPATAGVNLQESQQGMTLGVIIPFAALAVISVALRLVARTLMKFPIGLDDYLSIVGLMFALGCFALSVIMVVLGSGKHVEVVPVENIPRYLKCLYAYQLIYTCAILFIKFSILSFYQRIFSIRSFVIAARVIGSIVFVWWAVVLFISIFSCNPIYGFWDKTIDASCVNSKEFYVGNAVPNIVTDVLILTLPIRMVWTLKASTIQKLMLSVIFLLGSFVVVCSCVRLNEQFKVDDPDFTWAMNGTVIWTSLEVSFGVISACLPTLRPLLKLTFPWMYSSKSGTHQSYHPSQRGFQTLTDSREQSVNWQTTISHKNSDILQRDEAEIPMNTIQVQRSIELRTEGV